MLHKMCCRFHVSLVLKDCVEWISMDCQIEIAICDQSFMSKVWDRRILSEAHPRPVGSFSGHSLGITFIDTMVGYLHVMLSFSM